MDIIQAVIEKADFGWLDTTLAECKRKCFGIGLYNAKLMREKRDIEILLESVEPFPMQGVRIAQTGYAVRSS